MESGSTSMGGHGSDWVHGGWDNLPRFPCAVDKAPLTRRGFKDARRGPANVKWPLAGIATGAVSGVDVLDVDPDGIPFFNEMPLPATRHQLTRRGGLHLWFRHLTGLKCSAGRIRGIDVRADGGYVIDWHREGLDCLWPDLIADWPEWVLQQINPIKATSHAVSAQLPKQSKKSNVPLAQTGGHYHSQTRNLRARVRWNLNRLERQQRGGRSHMLFEVACQFGEMIVEGRIKPSVATQLMLSACRLNGLVRDYSKDEVLATIANAFRIIETREMGDG